MLDGLDWDQKTKAYTQSEQNIRKSQQTNWFEENKGNKIGVKKIRQKNFTLILQLNPPKILT